MSKYIDDVFDNLKIIDDVTNNIRAFAISPEHLGLDCLSKNLADDANYLEKATRKIRKAVGQEINDRYKQTQQSTANMINTALNMSKMKEQKKEKIK